MKELEKNKISTGLGVLLICLFSTIYILISYIVIMSKIGQYQCNHIIVLCILQVRLRRKIYGMEEEY